MKGAAVNDKEIYDCLVRHPGLKKLRTLFYGLLGNPVWWATPKLGAKSSAVKAFLDSSSEILNDARARGSISFSALAKALSHRKKETRPFVFTNRGGVLNFCMPMLIEDRVIGAVGVSGVKNGVREETFAILAEQAGLILENCAKTEELNRLSATIRPRAIALSTVHTVHRIINSTLNLNELVSRLAHLTAQVLRVNRCTIYLVERAEISPSGGASLLRSAGGRRSQNSLILKALVGYPKNTERKERILFGKGVEGRVAETAEIILRKQSICIPLIDEDVMGIMTVSYKKDKKPFTYFDREILTTLAEEAVIAIKNAQLYEEQKKVTLGTIQSLAVILGTRVQTALSPEIFLRLVLRVGQALRLNEEEMQALHYATLLKDTARIGIPEEILKKPTKLTGEEYQLLRDHPIKGAKIVQSFESLKPVAPIILYSREKFDGTGYPEGLKGEQIPMGARILAVINAFEAILYGRPYRDQASLTEALDEIRRNSGTQFDPKVVDAFIHIMEKEGFYRFLKHA